MMILLLRIDDLIAENTLSEKSRERKIFVITFLSRMGRNKTICVGLLCSLLEAFFFFLFISDI